MREITLLPRKPLSEVEKMPFNFVDYTKLSRGHPSLERGMVWCKTCHRSEKVDSTDCLRNGWPECCGYTMTIDHPNTWKK